MKTVRYYNEEMEVSKVVCLKSKSLPWERAKAFK